MGGVSVDVPTLIRRSFYIPLSTLKRLKMASRTRLSLRLTFTSVQRSHVINYCARGGEPGNEARLLGWQHKVLFPNSQPEFYRVMHAC